MKKLKPYYEPEHRALIPGILIRLYRKFFHNHEESWNIDISDYKHPPESEISTRNQ